MLGVQEDYQKYEAAVRAALENFVREQLPKAKAKVYGSRLYEGKSRLKHQIDVSVDGTLAGIRVFLIGECKCYRRKVSKRDVTAFCSIKNDLEPDFAFMFTTEGFDSGAQTFAETNNISLILQPKESARLTWEVIIPAAAILAVMPRQASARQPLDGMRGSKDKSNQAGDDSPFDSRPSAESVRSSGSVEASRFIKGRGKPANVAMGGSAYGIAGNVDGRSTVANDSGLHRGPRRRNLGQESRSSPDANAFREELSSSDLTRKFEAVDAQGTLLARGLRRLLRAGRRRYREEDHSPSFAEFQRAAQEVHSSAEALGFALSYVDGAVRGKAIDVVTEALAGVDLSDSLRYPHDLFLTERLPSGLRGIETLREVRRVLRSAVLQIVVCLTDSQVQGAAGCAIPRLYAGAPGGPLRSSFARRRRYYEHLGIWPQHLETELMRQIEDLVKSPNPSIREPAIIVLASLSDTRIVDTLAPLLSENGVLLRGLIADSFGRLHFDLKVPQDERRSEAAGLALASCLSSSEVSLRRQSAEALKIGGFPIARSAFPKALSDEDGLVRECAAIALADLGDARCIPVLIGIVGNPNAGSDYSAVEALAKTRSTRAIPVLTQKVRAATYDFERTRYLKAIETIDKGKADRLTTSLPPLPSAGALPTKKVATSEGLFSRVLGGIAVGVTVLSSKFGANEKTKGSRRDFLVPLRWLSGKGETGAEHQPNPSK